MSNKNGKLETGQFSTGLTTNVFTPHKERISGSILKRFLSLTSGGIKIGSSADTGLKVTDQGGGNIGVSAGEAYDKFGQRIFLETDDTGSGQFIGDVDLSSGVDLSTNYNIKLNIDSVGEVQVNCSTGAANTSAVTIDEIIANINSAGFGTIAYRADADGEINSVGNYILIKSPTTGGSSQAKSIAPTGFDATNEIFGLSETGYPHEFNGGGGYAIPADGQTYNILITYLGVENTVGDFLAGYPASGDSQYYLFDDSYKVTVTLSDPDDTENDHDIKLAEVINNVGVLTIVDKRIDSILYVSGVYEKITTPPPVAPVAVSLVTGDIDKENGYILPTWNKVANDNGVRAYIIKMTLEEIRGVGVENETEQERTYYSFDPTDATLSYRIELPRGNKYKVEVAAVDASLNQTVGAFGSLGSVTVGGNAEKLTMSNITLTPIINGVRVSWAQVTNAHYYQYVFTTDGTVPTFEFPFDIDRNYVDIPANPGETVTARVRVVNGALTESDAVQSANIAGGVVIANNQKIVTLFGGNIEKTFDGATARLLGKFYIPNDIVMKRMAISVTNFNKNSSEKGLVRIWRDNAEADAVYMAINEDGETTLKIDDEEKTAGWMIVDGYDSDESGADQAEFDIDVSMIYVDGAVSSTDKSASNDSI